MVCLADGVGLLSMLSLSPNPTRNPSWKWRPQRRSPSPCPGEHWGQHQQRTAVVTPSVVIVDVRVELVPHRIAFPSPPSLECCPFVPVSVVTIGDQLRQDAPPPHPCPTADCYFIRRCRHHRRWTLPPPLHDAASTSTFVAAAAD
jgi:hypothetical protein